MVNEVFHVGISNPGDIRRTLLESSKQVIYSLQRFEKVRALRVEKTEAIVKIKSQIAELTQLMLVLKKELPKTKLRASRAPDKIEPLEEPTRHKLRGAGELDKLEMELREVESKLNRLD